MDLISKEFAERVPAPEGWQTIPETAKQLERGYNTVQECVNSFREEKPEWFERFTIATGHVIEHIAPDLVEEIVRILGEREENRTAAGRERAESEELENNLESFLTEVSDGESGDAQDFQKLIQLFGSERTIDILFQHKPEYRKISLPFAKRVIGDYLGQFLVVRGDLQLEDLEFATRYLSNRSLREGLEGVIKNDCRLF